jgi:hypothetical protein
LFDQSNDRSWEYSRCLTNQMTDHENILVVWPIKWQIMRIFSFRDQSNDRLWEYSRCLTNQMTDHENILVSRPIKWQIVGIFSLCDNSTCESLSGAPVTPSSVPVEPECIQVQASDWACLHNGPSLLKLNLLETVTVSSLRLTQAMTIVESGECATAQT